MSKENNREGGSIAELVRQYGDQALAVLKESNDLAHQRFRLAEQAYQQSVLNYEQVERQYLIEKSHLQPRFRLFVSEFLMSEPDFLNDPELASEAAFLSSFGVAIDERVLRFRLDVKGDAQYMRPSLVIGKQRKQADNECAHSMSDLLYFIPANRIDFSDDLHSFPIYFVYRDKTTLPVVHKYQVTQQHDSTLSRWNVVHLDTGYAVSHKNLAIFNSAAGCEQLFIERQES